MTNNIENFLDAYAIVAPQIRERPNYRRTLARLIMTVWMIKADRVIKYEELSFLIKLTCAKFDVSDEVGKALCTELCEESEHAPDLDALVSYIKAHSTLIERADCVREMWEAAVCDRELHDFEDDLAFRCATLLDVDVKEVSWLQELAVNIQAGSLSDVQRTP